ncbi:MAG: hypothetical protein ABIO94_11575, partial [Opitutaceae bacterium]
HYVKRFPESRRFALLGIKARFGLSGNRLAALVALESLPAPTTENERLTDVYLSASRRGSFAAAERALANPKLTGIVDEGAIVIEPVSLHLALLAFAQGRLDRARAPAEEAIAALRRQSWTPRQAPWGEIRVAWGEALAGRSEDALRRARSTFAALSPGSMDALWMRHELGLVYLFTGRKEEALAILQEMMSDPAWLSPNEIRYDPVWSQLSSDPRFEKILRSAKTL